MQLIPFGFMAVGIILLWIGVRSLDTKKAEQKRLLVYLAGPIAGCTDEECMAWRDYVTAHLGADHVLNPMRRDFRGVDVAPPAEIVEGDKADIDRATHVLVYFEMIDRPFVGTSMEVLYAWERGIPIILVTPHQILSPWLVYHSTWICETFDQAFRLLETAPQNQGRP